MARHGRTRQPSITQAPILLPVRHAYADEFNAYRPDQEKTHRYSFNHKGKALHDLSYIRSSAPNPSTFDFDQFFQRMIRHGWRGAQHHDGARTGGRLMGGHRRGLAGGHRSARGERPLFGHAKEWNKIRDFERVVAYAFRGDKREPAAIKAAGGFHPPSTRTDPAYVQKIAEKFVAYMQQRFNRNVTVAEATSYIRGQGRAGKDFVEYELWRMILDREQLHVGRMIRNEFLKGYISTTRDIYTATNFVEEDGWVYLVHTVGGLLVPPLGGHQWAICQEHEIAHPGPLPWRSVVGFRRCGGAGKTVLGLSGPVFLRRGFERREPQAFQQAFDVLSGGDQG